MSQGDLVRSVCVNTLLRKSQSPVIPKLTLLYVFEGLTSMSRGRRVILCMGRMRKEIIGRFLQSGWPSILVSTSLKAGFLDLEEKIKVS